jgi:putative pyrroloquinoline-quinone binding quinoprotein
MNRFYGRMGRRAARGFLGRIQLGTAGPSARLRRWVLAAVLLGVALVPYPSPGAVTGAPVAACRSGCRPGSVPSMIRWIRPLPGSWQVISGLTGTAPASGLAYVSVGYGVAAVGIGLTVYGYSSKDGAPLWSDTLTGFPAGAAIVSVRAWPGEVTAGVTYSRAGHLKRVEVVISGPAGIPLGHYPAAVYGGAVEGGAHSTVIVGTKAVTSYDNATGHVRWSVPTGQVPQAWRTDDGTLYVAQSTGGFLGSAPVTALLKVDMATGAEITVRPLEGLSYAGTLSAAFDGVVLFSSADGVTAYDGTTGVSLWSVPRAVPEGTDPRKGRIYLTAGSNLIAVNPATGRVTATASGSAVDASAGMYVVRDGVVLGLDQGAGGDAWGYNLGAQRVTLAAAGLPWPHYFVDLSGVGGSADPVGDLVVIAACAKLASAPPTSPASPSSPASPTASASSASSVPSGPSVIFTATPAATATGTPATSVSVSTTPSPGASVAAVQGCLHPELVALSL